MTLTGKDRIEADRLWRNPEARRQFEAETNFTSNVTIEDYEVRFLEWARRRIIQDRVR
jgi:hypothetical protein